MHIFSAELQPATGFFDQCGEVEFRGGWGPGEMIRCGCCGKKRLAKNCVVQCYYDGLRIWCADGHGCKHPQAIARKRWQEHMNRSRAQQARRSREKTPNVEVSGLRAVCEAPLDCRVVRLATEVGAGGTAKK